MELREQRTFLCDKSIEGYNNGLFAGTSGNLSLRDKESGLVLITPSGFSYSKMTPRDIMVITLDGEVVEGEHRPSSEWRMHNEIYRQMPLVSSVVHTHSPYATAFAVAGMPIPVVLIEMMYFLLGEVFVADYAPPGSLELGKSVSRSLCKRGACLMKNHGAIAVGESLDSAYTRAIYTEDAAKIYYMARSLGQFDIIPKSEQNRMRSEMGVPEE